MATSLSNVQVRLNAFHFRRCFSRVLPRAGADVAQNPGQAWVPAQTRNQSRDAVPARPTSLTVVSKTQPRPCRVGNSAV